MSRLQSRSSRGPAQRHGGALGERRPHRGRSFLLAVVMLVHAACASGVPLGGRAGDSASRAEAVRLPSRAPASPGPRVLDEVGVVLPGTVPTRPVSVDREAFQHALQGLAREVAQRGSPREAARELLERRLTLTGQWLVEVDKGRVLTLVPLEDEGALSPVEQDALREASLRWCEPRGGGDCLGLFEDGPYLRADDRRTLALALAFGSVLDEAREALARELDVRAVLASLVWAVGVYFTMWLVPEPTTKAAAGALTVLLVGWLGVDTLWGLVDGWARLATQAHRARTFSELKAAGGEYAKVLGTDAARALIMAVAALTGRTLGEVAARARTLPGYGHALAQCEAQGLWVPLPVAVETVEAVVITSQGALAVLTTAPAGPATAMLSRDASRGETTGPGGQRVKTVIRHRKGNRQVELENLQRWHLPPGVSARDIPVSDPLGDQLQAAATRFAKEWGPHLLSSNEREAIKEALAQGKRFQADRLEAQARGRWVEEQLRLMFNHLKWNRRGVDVTGPSGSSHHYEVLSETRSNFERHGRRMADTFFRMIFF